MEIKTKFNVGDKICVIDYFDEWEVKWVNVKITGIEILIKGKNKTIIYNIDSLIYGGYNEQYCFTTKEQAQAECDRRNNERTN